MNEENNQYTKRVQNIDLHEKEEKIEGKPDAYKNIFSEDDSKKSNRK
ncbi:hypothetical protein [Anaerovorax odorimutans]|nr:hypothetical protein [Anaerovorax odorimutans]